MPDLAPQADLQDGTIFDDVTGNRLLNFLIARLRALGVIPTTDPTLTEASGTGVGNTTTVTVNQSGTASYVAYLLNVVRTAVGSGTKLLMDLQLAGVSKFKITETGVVTAALGFIATAGGFTATAGDITATAGEFIAGTAGKGLSVKEGSNARMGVSAAMTAGSIVISTTAIAAGDRIQLQHVTPGGTMGHLSYGTIVAATSFVITSSSGTDTSTVLWHIIKPSA